MAAYRRLCSRLGLTMLFHMLLMNAVYPAVVFIYELIAGGWEYRVYSIGYSLLSAALYLLCFMLPVLFFRILARGEAPVSMGMEPAMPPRTVAMVAAVLGVNLACAYCNSIFMQMLDSLGIGNVLDYIPMSSFIYPEDIVFLHLSLALVPAFCEEFLFRGLICARLMPYGKTAAIVGSAVLFGLMHGNLGQLFYTTVAGIMLGWCFVETRSIWPGVIAHMLNNLMGVLSEYWYTFLPVEKASAVDFFSTAGIFLMALPALIWLVAAREREKPILGLGNTRPLDVGAVSLLPAGEGVRGFFRPSMTVYFVLAIGGILLYMLLGTLFSWLEAAGIPLNM
ncbi:MAG: CPBP family intramembrane metalloprotease [Ruminococcaceae bacterium]|nr:CPBP family intramembrane metalloprotease [Oscillospiraceae bacterium]